MLIYPVGESEVHPPRTHHNLISLQTTLEGKIHLREYDRLRRVKNGQLVVKPVSDRILSADNYFIAKDWKNNAHWFCVHEGPAVIFNINLRGFSTATFDNEIGQPFGREYIDPTKVGHDGIILAEEIAKVGAFKRFEDRILSTFP